MNTYNYITNILDRPPMYMGSANIQTLEMLLLNLLNFRADLFEVDVDVKEILRKQYLEHFGESAGAGGPSSKLIEKYGDDVFQEDVQEFYRDFVDVVMEAQAKAEKENDHQAALRVEQILIANLYSQGRSVVALYVTGPKEGAALLSELAHIFNTKDLDLKFLGAWPHECPHCEVDRCEANEPQHCWWDYDGKCSECGKHPFIASPQKLEKAGGFLPGAPKFEKEDIQ